MIEGLIFVGKILTYNIAMAVAILLFAFSLTLGDEDWSGRGGQDHHPLGRALIINAIICGIAVLCSAILGTFVLMPLLLWVIVSAVAGIMFEMMC